MKDDPPVQVEELQRLRHDWRESVHISEKFQTYQDVFIELLVTFESTSDGRLRRINIGKHHTDLRSKEN